MSEKTIDLEDIKKHNEDQLEALRAFIIAFSRAFAKRAKKVTEE